VAGFRQEKQRGYNSITGNLCWRSMLTLFALLAFKENPYLKERYLKKIPVASAPTRFARYLKEILFKGNPYLKETPI
jgi:hypothetical protein